ncbi:hypothetical protein FISHEDRAFT_75586 [Fistulina hepatica ATCC 64428]|uniref:DUF6534 domain-containing protein n=1 Tax=Fistulina hepatica ATCC 64428 TaxID=1128425 RepID=A0A0D7A983_9AGAR|nr:hypothetical protein FISHEDRAFT_75586 [Fistulina hepatica ATCC 64428]
MTSEVSMILYEAVLQIQDPTTNTPDMEALYAGSMSAVIMTDLSLTLSLVYLLLRHQTGALKGTKHIISRLVTYSLTTGALSLTLAIVGMTLDIVFPSVGYDSLFSMPLVPVYLISLLASLNVRRSLRDAGQINNTTFSLPAMSSGGAMSTTGGISHAQNSGVPSGSIHFAPNPETTKSTNVVGSSSEKV